MPMRSSAPRWILSGDQAGSQRRLHPAKAPAAQPGAIFRSVDLQKSKDMVLAFQPSSRAATALLPAGQEGYKTIIDLDPRHIFAAATLLSGSQLGLQSPECHIFTRYLQDPAFPACARLAWHTRRASLPMFLSAAPGSFGLPESRRIVRRDVLPRGSGHQSLRSLEG
jgi:hypothetical protein